MQFPSRRIHPARSPAAPDESGGSDVLTIVEGSCNRFRDAPTRTTHPAVGLGSTAAARYNVRMAQPLSEREFERILLIKPSSLGDVIQALPILDGLRSRYPSAHIAWLVASPFVELVEPHPALNEVIPFDRKRFGRLGRSWRVTVEFVRFVASLRRRRFDLVVDLQGLFRSGFFARACGADVRIGPSKGREGAWIFYRHRFPAAPLETHTVTRMWAAAELLGFGGASMTFRLPITDDDRACASRFLTEAGLDADGGYVVVCPEARWPTKVWPAERFAAVVDRLAEARKLPAVLVGSASADETCNAVAAAAASHPVNLAGKTTLRQAAALIERARLVLTGDSGPMHMADVLGRPLVALFGPTNPVRTGPYNQPDAVIRADLPCMPCYIKRLSRCSRDHACMGDLGADDVADAAISALDNARET